MDSLTVASQQILDECRDDYVGLWSIVRTVQDSQIEKSRMRETTLSLLSKLLAEGEIVAGMFGEGRFQTWDMPVESIIAKVEDEWRALGRDPDIGEIVWFTSSDWSATE